MENRADLINQLKGDSGLPTSMLTEITESDFMNAAKDTQNASETEIYRDINKDPQFQQTQQTVTDAMNTGSSTAQNGIPDMRGKGVVNLGKVVNPKIGLTVVDNVIPLLLMLLFRFGLDMKVSKKEFQLTASERNDIEPYLQDCLSTINIDFSNPWTALGFVVAMLYGSKATELGVNKYMDKLEAGEKEKAGNKTSSGNKRGRPFGSTTKSK